ncbi:MAG: RCKP-type rubredoxin-like domain-containing protein [Thermoleophilia bacterium]
MATFKCAECGATSDGRCKPKKCPDCGAAGSMEKKE